MRYIDANWCLDCTLIKLCFHAVAGDITQKGYEKKRTRLLQQYASKQIGESFSIYAFLGFIRVLAVAGRDTIAPYPPHEEAAT